MRQNEWVMNFYRTRPIQKTAASDFIIVRIQIKNRM
jgi:hypothetical protein